MANLNKAPNFFTYSGEGPHPLSRAANNPSYAFTVPDYNGGGTAAGDIPICEPCVGVFLIWYDNGSTIESALFATDLTVTTEMASTTTANWSGGTAIAVGDVTFYYDSTSGMFRLTNDVAAATYTFYVCRLA